MEFPDLGQHCSVGTCKQLDFLPMKCDSCHKIFCNDHFSYAKHECPEAYRKNNQVPVCPLCNTPIPVKRGEAPDLLVGQHIDNDCQSDPAKQKRKIYTNKCNVKGCKQKELIPVSCDRCQLNFCLRHRLESDHDCKGFEGSGRAVSSAATAAVNRSKAGGSRQDNGPFKSSKAKPQQTHMAAAGKDLDRERRARQAQSSGAGAGSTRSMQGGMSEDEALARALALSAMDSQPPQAQGQRTRSTPQSDDQKRQEEEDLALARALQASEEESRPRQRQATQRQTSDKEKSSCAMS